MSKLFREYIELKLAAVEKEAARLRAALEVVEDYEADGPAPARPDKPKQDSGKQAGAKRKAPAGTRSRRGKRKCTVEGCSEVHVARGLCKKHYDAARKQGRTKAAASNGTDPDPPLEIDSAAEADWPKGGRVPCHHPNCDATVPFTEAAMDEPQYCSDFCRNNHAKFVAEA